MAVNKVDYGNPRAEDTNRGHSQTIWADCPITELLENPRKGFYLRDGFELTALLATPTITTQAYYNNGWKAFGSAGGTLLSAFLEGGGGLKADETDDNQGVNFATLALPFKLSRSSGKFWWEARVKFNNIADLDTGFLAGLLDQQTLTAILPITAAGAIADVNMVGFRRDEADGDQLDTVYKADGVTAVTVKGDAMADLPTNKALVADTFVKIGMKYDPSGSNNAGAFALKFYINGYELPTKKVIPTANGTDFPNDVQMGLFFAILCGSNNDSTLTVDWVEVAQAFVND